MGASHPPERVAKFRQAAFVYLHVGLLYEAAVWAIHRAGLLPETRGPVWAWLAFGAVILAAVFWGLWWWQNVWVARGVWALHALRLPAVLEGAFLAGAEARLSAGLYQVALAAVLVNLWMLARAGWDL